MPTNQSQNLNSQTLVIDEDKLEFDALEQQNGVATVIKFKLWNPEVKPGDVLLILSGTDVQFHGFIGKVEDGYGYAIDRSGSSLPAGIH